MYRKIEKNFNIYLSQFHKHKNKFFFNIVLNIKRLKYNLRDNNINRNNSKRYLLFFEKS